MLRKFSEVRYTVFNVKAGVGSRASPPYEKNPGELNAIVKEKRWIRLSGEPNATVSIS